MLRSKILISSQPLSWLMKMRLMSTQKAEKFTELLSQADSGQEDQPLEWTNCHWYPETKDLRRCQARKGLSINPQGTSIVIFPGENTPLAVGGSGSVANVRGRFQGGRPAPAKAREMFATASDSLGYDLEEELVKNPGCQPAILVESLAAVDEVPNVDTCVATAGFGLGELTALVFAGAIDFLSGVKLAAIREEAVRQVSAEVPSGLLAVAYGPDSKLGYGCKVAEQVAKKQGRAKAWCGVAAFLYPHCKVVGGHHEALEFLIQNGADFKLRACRRLPVPGALYTPIMSPAVPLFAEALKEVKINDPKVSVYTTCRKGRSQAQRYTTIEDIRRRLPLHLAVPIQWEQTLHAIYERKTGSDFPQTYLCGPGGKQLGEVLKLVNAKAAAKANSFVCS